MQKRSVLPALCAAFAFCAASAFAAMPDGEFAKLCYPGTAAQVKQALKDGANPNARDERDPVSADPALHSAARSDTEAADKVRALLAAGADVEARERRYGTTALMTISNPEVAAVLLAAGAAVDGLDRTGQTALFYAAMNGNVPMIEALLRAGAAVNARSDSGGTALIEAASNGQPEAVRALLAAGADAKLKDGNGDALWHARHPSEDADREHAAACVKLLQGGAKKPAQATPQEAAKAAAAPAKTYTNSIGMEFVLIPAGTFQMGCTSSADKCEDNEKRHTVTISKPFYLGKYEVTQAQWEVVMGDNPSVFRGANLPVSTVSWVDAQMFVEKLNAKEGHNRYRLPTEAEWEYAARAGSTTVYSFGDDAAQLGDYAWYADNAGGEPHPVGQKQPNAWGLFDMHGNVYEWVQDYYGKYGAGAVTDPRGPAGVGELSVRRGGSWNDPVEYCRTAFRSNKKPGLHFDSEDGLRLA
ncbi:MAG: SUMF1/EgtB/PvdO family nonheme iron enzyme, partial [Ottowia sp.]|nr:SUMF1/EgtB/PvdO family nonheme iron enzyme [Ottowia sp.]